MIRSVDDPMAFMPEHVARRVSGPVPCSVDGVLSLLASHEAAILRLGDAMLHVETSGVVPHRRWRRATVTLFESPSPHDDPWPVVEVAAVFESCRPGEMSGEFWVERVSRLLALDARCR